ncbi:immunity 8 family protein [Bradyrhizobium sp. CCGUVB4N]|uniref:immunity 8 family protein n=1 Tax=unclassified Bradyrhizobium TaxID=2631580 RepID=UPI0020B2DED3|nr:MULTISPECIES: immunity 8 family protein [unclassified Bradyrhizobium]MCP3382599.1 immunity 8 family protein [Bradyrhizobium sp. CCGUVB4N]WFU77781.1 immunity 8 family protein [Bradyrhizobium sp. CIAT3101]
MVVVANLRRLSCSDTPSLEAFWPEGPFGIYISAMVGPAGGPGEESFGFTLCTPEWFAENMKDAHVPGRHFLFVKEYDYPALEQYVRGYCQRCMGNSWKEVAEKVGLLGSWEFENYEP